MIGPQLTGARYRMKLRVFLGVATVCVLAGCVRGQADYLQGAATQSQFDKDSIACELDGHRHASEPIHYELVYDACMRTKGYERNPALASRLRW